MSAVVVDATLAAQLLNLLLGAQIAAALGVGNTEPDFEDQLEGFLTLLVG